MFLSSCKRVCIEWRLVAHAASWIAAAALAGCASGKLYYAEDYEPGSAEAEEAAQIAAEKRQMVIQMQQGFNAINQQQYRSGTAGSAYPAGNGSQGTSAQRNPKCRSAELVCDSRHSDCAEFLSRPLCR